MGGGSRPFHTSARGRRGMLRSKRDMGYVASTLPRMTSRPRICSLGRMLKAHLHRKLRRKPAGAEEEGDADADDAMLEGLTGLEDPLTSTIFERFAYLP